MHSLLESYLSEVAAHLSALPIKQRKEELREMRTHLENASLVSRELGQTEDEAAQSIVAQFGTPQALGQSTVTAWRRGVMLDRRSFLGAAVIALALMFLLPRLIDPPVVAYFKHFTGENPPPMPPWAVGAMLAWAFGVPAFEGGLSGALFPKRAVAGTALAVILSFLLMAVSIVYWNMHHPHLLNSADRLKMGETVTFRFVLTGATLILSAWAGSRARLAWGKRRRLART